MLFLQPAPSVSRSVGHFLDLNQITAQPVSNIVHRPHLTTKRDTPCLTLFPPLLFLTAWCSPLHCRYLLSPPGVDCWIENPLMGAIYVVAASKDGRTEYWVAA